MPVTLMPVSCIRLFEGLTEYFLLGVYDIYFFLGESYA